MGHGQGASSVQVRIELSLSPDTRLFLAELARQLHRRFDRLEHRMSKISDYFDATNATLTTINDTLTDVASDVTALLTKAGGAGVFTAEEQALADAATAKLTALGTALSALDTQVGDQDGSEGGPTPPPAG